MAKKKSAEKSILLSPAYQPNDLLNYLIAKCGLKNDAQLCRFIECQPPYISKVRKLKLPIGASFLIDAHLATGAEIKDMIKIAGMTSAYRV